VLPVPLSRMLAAYTLIRESGPNIGTGICIPVTNAIESLNRVIRKSIKTRGSFPTDEAATKLIAMRKHGRHEVIVTDKIRSYGAALKEIRAAHRQETGRWLNNRAENSHLPFRRRERAMLRFRRMRSLQKFSAVHASIYNLFNSERSLTSRSVFKLNRAAALAEWRQLGTA